ncbi:MAG: glycosyltransferase family 4 protein [Candidatus Saccharibacteria bacterium]
MKILWLTWKDRSHPLAGGAESVSGEIMDRLVLDGHTVKVITARYTDSIPRENVNGVNIYRVGNRYSVYLKARQLYKAELSGWADLVIDEMNTIPFGSGFYNKTRNVLLCYQLAREIWFYQMPFPLSLVGYLIEPFMLRRLSKKYPVAITESKSTKNDLGKYGFNNTNIFRVGMSLQPLTKLDKKPKSNIVLSLGAIRPMKRTLDAIKAFEIARDSNDELNMVIAGDKSGKYAQKVIKYASKSRHANAINIAGRVSNTERLNLMRKADVILVASVKEGWGLIVTEANSQGTPAIVYDTDGLRDSVQNNVTGILVPSLNYRTMGNNINSLLADTKKYESFRLAAWEWSKEFTFENSYKDFLKAVNIKK